MAESNSSSESSTSASDSSDFEGAIAADLSGDEIEPFRGIEPWRFEPPGRATETQEREDFRREVGATDMTGTWRPCLWVPFQAYK